MSDFTKMRDYAADLERRLAEFRAMLSQSGENRVRASLILKTFDDLFSVEK